MSSPAVLRRRADVVVVGTGVAGLAAALELEGRAVHLLTKTKLASGSSPWAQGGVAAAIGTEDSPELHAADTIAAGAGLVDPAIAELLARDGVAAVRRLIELGAQFDRSEQGEISLGREAAHSRRRILHARGDATGAELVRTLAERVRQAPWIELFEGAFAAELAIEEGRIAGLLVRHGDGSLVLHEAPHVVLATGGLGQLYRFTTNPIESTGDGLVLAAAAGARLVDLEFVQFHPTALAVSADPLPLLTEALRGEGALLLNDDGERFMAAEHPGAELAPRDVVARGIWRQLARGRKVHLDAREAVGERFPTRFPTVFAACREAGIDPRVEPMPVVPAAHYHMGGIAVDEWGRSSVPGLWACGEVSATGVHGANRLASNSLLEAMVFGGRVAEAIGAERETRAAKPATAGLATRWCESALDPARGVPELRRAARELAWERVGLVRERDGLESALARFEELLARLPHAACEARSLVVAGWLVAAVALRRTESRGAHFRSDYPEPSEAWKRRQFLTAEVGPNGIDVRFDSGREGHEITAATA